MWEVEEFNRALTRLKEGGSGKHREDSRGLEIEFSELASSKCADLVELRLEKYTTALSELPFCEFSNEALSASGLAGDLSAKRAQTFPRCAEKHLP